MLLSTDNPAPKTNPPLVGKTILITGGARRIGRSFSIACAAAGADIILTHAHSPVEAGKVQQEIQRLGRRAWIIQADFSNAEQAISVIRRATEQGPLFGLINNAAIFAPVRLSETSLASWEEHLRINLTAPFLLSQGFAAALQPGEKGRIVNILDWRAIRPGRDHFPYTISKAGLAALTRSLALSLAPAITVNGLALGAILPPAGEDFDPQLVKRVPAQRWADLQEVDQALLFLLTGPEYITGEIIHVDGGRHLV